MPIGIEKFNPVKVLSKPNHFLGETVGIFLYSFILSLLPYFDSLNAQE